MKKSIIIFLILLMTSAVFCADKSLLKFRFVNKDINPAGTIPESCEKLTIYNNLEKMDYVVEKEIVFDGSHIKQIELKCDRFFSEIYEIVLTFDEEGTKIFSDLTAHNIGKSLLMQIDNSYLFDAVIREAITSDSVSVSGFTNMIILMKLKENFTCIDNTNINFDELKFTKSTFTPNSYQAINKKDPIQVMAAFLYYYKQNNPEWKKLVYPDIIQNSNQFIENLEFLRTNIFSSINQYDIYVTQMNETINTPPAFFFRDQDYIDVYLPFKLENQENIIIRNINLLVNKDGEYFVKHF